MRDFVHVRDVARACMLALETPTGIGNVYNVGSGQSRSILSIGRDLAMVMGCGELSPHVLGKYRAGDIRHCFADISLSRAELGFEPGNKVASLQPVEALAIGAARKSLRLVTRWEVPGLEH